MTTPYHDRYGFDVLSSDPHERPAVGSEENRRARRSRPRPSRAVPAEIGMVVEHVGSGFVGEIVKITRVAGQWQMVLEGRGDVRRSFPLGHGYWIDGESVELLLPERKPSAPKAKTVAGHTLTASGSLHVEHRARVAKASRIWVEGRHDAQLVSKVWGEDLAFEGIMIEELFGADNLLGVLDVFSPSKQRRAGILVDHMVEGSKEWRIAHQASGREGVLVLGHPYVDVWQAVKPSVLGLRAWPEVPRGEDIKLGTLHRLGWLEALIDEASADVAERGLPIRARQAAGRPAYLGEASQEVLKAASGLGWARILARVRSYKDLEPSLLGRIEELIDFVTVP